MIDAKNGAIPYRLQGHTAGIDWEAVCLVLKEAGLRVRPAEVVRKAFENSFRVVFVFDGELLVGIGRAVSDGVYEAALYDIAVLPAYQGNQVGRMIVGDLHKSLQDMNVILFANPGKEAFYGKLGYSRLLTGMARFTNADALRQRGFIE